MKKIMIIAAAAALVSGAFGADVVQPTFDEVKASYQAVLQIAATNVNAAYGKAMKEVIHPLNNPRLFIGPEADAFRAEVDDTLSSLGLWSVSCWYTKKDLWCAKTAKIAFDRDGLVTNAPYAVSLGQKYERYCRPNSFSENMITVEEFIGLVNENLDLVDGKFRMMYSYGSLGALRKKLQKACVKPVKKYLRSQGKSFVTKDGVNPCEGLMTELNTALNAPYFNGLNAWLSKIGINASVDVSKLPTAAEVQTLKNAVLNADKDLTPMDDAILKICLGVDGYNAFVKEYNGEQ